jgi:hypothetical protein
MRRPAPSVIAALVSAAALALTPVLARAQGAGGDAGTCAPVERELAASRHAAEEARHETVTAEREVTSCKRELDSTSAHLQQSSEATKSCEQSRERVCGATVTLVDELTHGRTHSASDTGCVTPEAQAKLDAAVGGWSNAATWMSQLAAYQAGETDTFPRPRAGNTVIDRAVQRVGRDGGGPAFHRRLLVESLKIVAPRAWERIRTGGATSIDTWFAAAPAALDRDLVTEAARAPAAALGPAGPPLTAALHLVRAFQLAASCSGASTDGGACGRAWQLQQLLESTGSLVLRRRVQEIWATDCTSISPAAVTAWLGDFPTAHVADDTPTPWTEIAETAHAKLFACYLDDSSEHASYGTWLKDKLPGATALTAVRLQRVDAISGQWNEASREAVCARAVRAMQNMTVPATCAAPSKEFRDALVAWTAASAKLDDASVPLTICAQFARLQWEGKAASIDGSFAHPPSLDEMVVAKPMPPTPISRLRAHCEERRGAPASFAEDIAKLASFARGFGEGTDRAPFRVDPATSKPVELVRFEAAQGIKPWFSHVTSGASACSMVGLKEDRCKLCSEGAAKAAYDCELVTRLDDSWVMRMRELVAAIALLLVLVVGGGWLARLRVARRTFATWRRDATTFFDGIGLVPRADPWRIALPSRHDTLELMLPSDPAWELWGKVAALVRVPSKQHVLGRDVNHAAFVARRLGASVALLEHDDDATLDLSAVRAMLEWAARGGAHAVQILPIGVSRARWSKSAHDVLDLVEESSLRGNPFELRGRVATSTQFFNRERLVSGLLAAAEAGHWTVITGLRRFGKSSLALEVARRLPGPSAYVDVAGFDHEIVHRGDPTAAVDAILRFVCLGLLESARARWPKAEMPSPPKEGSSLGVAALTEWFRDLSRACHEASGRAPPLLVVLDELEQALAVGPERLAHALDVLATVIGRLKSAVGDAAAPGGSSPVGVFLTSALHPLLWAPLRTLAHQSIMGSFQRVCVPCLGEDAATAMMRGLGARQGIRFSDAALASIVKESQGVPLLLRRLGGSILELYDAERARQGSLGAVEVGVEGAAEAIDREGREGSPVRVWIETEIAPRTSVVGALLRRLVQEDVVSMDTLCTLAKQKIAAEFVRTGIAATLAPDELARRAEEAAHVMVQLLQESDLLVSHGDLTSPDAYSLPDGLIRRVLQAQASVSSSFPVSSE